MRLPDYHTHSARCGHARGTPAEYVEAARAAGLLAIGVADHLPLLPDPDPELSMEACELGDYVAEVQELKAALPRIRPPRHRGRLPARDHLRGSRPCSRASRSTTSSARSTISATGASTTPGRSRGTARVDIDDVWVEYFELVGEAAESGLFTIMGHLDLVKKFGYRATRVTGRRARPAAGAHRPGRSGGGDQHRRSAQAGQGSVSVAGDPAEAAGGGDTDHLRLRRAPARGSGTGLRPRGRSGPGGRVRRVRHARADPAGGRAPRRTVPFGGSGGGSAGRAERAPAARRAAMKAAVIFNPSSGRGRAGAIAYGRGAGR